MEQKIINYLGKVDKYLKPLNAIERADIVKEIKSEIVELENNGISVDEILNRLGNPKDLAKAYLSDVISKGKPSLHNFTALIAFYSLSGISGLFIIPITSIFAFAFIVSGVVLPISGIVKFIAHLCGIELVHIGIIFGDVSVGPFLFLPISIVLGAITLVIGFMFWKLTVWIVKLIGRNHRKINGCE